MDPKTRARFDARAKIVKALAHPTRLFIVDRLSQQAEECVCELTEMIGADMSTVSKHLSVLKGAGLICDEKRGAQVYYKLKVCCLRDFFACVESVLESNVAQQQELLA